MSGLLENPNDIVDGVTYEVVSGNFRRRLVQVESHSTSDESTVNGVSGISGNIGTVRSNGFITLSLTTRRAKNVPNEVDWQGLKRANSLFNFEIQEDGGSRELYLRCRVRSVAKTGGADGNVTHAIELISQSYQEIQVNG